MGQNAADNQFYSISEASEILGISKATVKNWVKLGKLSCISRNPYVFSKEEIHSMHKKLDNSEYLKSRRNKTRLSSNYMPKSYINSSSPNYPIIKSLIRDLEVSQVPIWDIISCYARSFFKAKDIPAGVADSLLGDEASDLPFNILNQYPLDYVEGEDTLGMLYISLRRLQEKKSTGSYYTPFYVVDRIVNEGLAKNMQSSAKIIDPSCGTGNFLLRLPGHLPPKNIYGSDIDATAVAIARINLVLKYDVRTSSTLDTIKQNIMLQDFLKNEKNNSYDIVIGNPPWGYVFPKGEYPYIKKNFQSYTGTKMPESFSLFIEKSLRNLSDNGTLSFLLPESVLDVRTHEAIRSLILDESYVVSIDYLGEVFDKVQCPCIILTLRKSGKDDHPGNTEVSFSKIKKSAIVTERAFSADSGRLGRDSFHLLCSDDENKLLEKIESVPHFTLKDNATFALGIVTGSNKTSLSDRPEPGYEVVIKGKDIEKFRINPSGNYIRFTPESFQQCAPSWCYRAKDKLFYRFIADEPIVALDEEGIVSLNSANIIIPNVPDYSARYIMAILNSDVISFYYRHRFRSMKVLRSSLEALPIPLCSESDRQGVEDLVLRNDYEALNRKIRSLYGFE